MAVRRSRTQSAGSSARCPSRNGCGNRAGSSLRTWRGTPRTHVQSPCIRLLRGAESVHNSEFWSRAKTWRKRMPAGVAWAQSRLAPFWILSRDQSPSSWVTPSGIRAERRTPMRARPGEPRYARTSSQWRELRPVHWGRDINVHKGRHTQSKLWSGKEQNNLGQGLTKDPAER